MYIVGNFQFNCFWFVLANITVVCVVAVVVGRITPCIVSLMRIGLNCLQQVNTWRPELIELEDRAKQVLSFSNPISKCRYLLYSLGVHTWVCMYWCTHTAWHNWHTISDCCQWQKKKKIVVYMYLVFLINLLFHYIDVLASIFDADCFASS